MLIASTVVFGAEETKPTVITIDAGASLKATLDNLITIYKEKNNVEIEVTYGSSGVFKQQIKYGAPVDIVLFSDATSIKELIEAKLVDKSDITYPIYNNLNLIGYKPIKSIDELKGLLVIGDPEISSLGKYSKEYLENMGVYNKLKPDMVYAKDSLGVATYVENKFVDYGILFDNELSRLKESVVILKLDPSKYEKPFYTFAIIKGHKNDATKAFFNFLNSKEAMAIFKEDDFSITAEDKGKK